jgi:hypothetical protein
VISRQPVVEHRGQGVLVVVRSRGDVCRLDMGKPRRPRTRVRSQLACPHCGQAYEGFRSPDVPTFAQAAAAMLQHAQRLADEGDYSKPARLPAVLGYMHGCKKKAWRDHLYWCELEQQAAAEVPF